MANNTDNMLTQSGSLVSDIDLQVMSPNIGAQLPQAALIDQPSEGGYRPIQGSSARSENRIASREASPRVQPYVIGTPPGSASITPPALPGDPDHQLLGAPAKIVERTVTTEMTITALPSASSSVQMGSMANMPSPQGLPQGLVPFEIQNREVASSFDPLINLSKEQLIQEVRQMHESSAKLSQEYKEEAIRYVTECSSELGKQFQETAESYQTDARNLCVQEANAVHGRMVNKMNQQLFQQERGHEFKMNLLEQQVEQTMEEQKNMILQETSEAHSRQQQRIIAEARGAIAAVEQQNQESTIVANRKVTQVENQAAIVRDQAEQLNLRLEQLQPENNLLGSQALELQEQVTLYEESRREVEAKVNFLSEKVLQQYRSEERMKNEFQDAYHHECESVKVFKDHFVHQEQLNDQLQRQVQQQAHLLSESTANFAKLEDKNSDISITQLALEGKLKESQRELEESITHYRQAESTLKSQQEEIKGYRYALLQERSQVSDAQKRLEERERVREQRAKEDHDKLEATLEQFQRFREEAKEEKEKMRAQIEELSRKNYHLERLGPVAQAPPPLPQALQEPRDVHEPVLESNRGREFSDKWISSSGPKMNVGEQGSLFSIRPPQGVSRVEQTKDSPRVLPDVRLPGLEVQSYLQPSPPQKEASLTQKSYASTEPAPSAIPTGGFANREVQPTVPTQSQPELADALTKALTGNLQEQALTQLTAVLASQLDLANRSKEAKDFVFDEFPSGPKHKLWKIDVFRKLVKYTNKSEDAIMNFLKPAEVQGALWETMVTPEGWGEIDRKFADGLLKILKGEFKNEMDSINYQRHQQGLKFFTGIQIYCKINQKFKLADYEESHLAITRLWSVQLEGDNILKFDNEFGHWDALSKGFTSMTEECREKLYCDQIKKSKQFAIKFSWYENEIALGNRPRSLETLRMLVKRHLEQGTHDRQWQSHLDNAHGRGSLAQTSQVVSGNGGRKGKGDCNY